MLGLRDYGLQGMLGPLLDPATRTLLLAAPIPGGLASDSAVSLVSNRALAKAAGDETGSRRFAEAASSLYSRLARLDSTESQWQLGLARVALLRGRPDEAIEDARRAVTMHPVASDYYEGPNSLAMLAEAHAAAGHTDSALAHLRVLVTQPG